jgi:hypothetical protein
VLLRILHTHPSNPCAGLASWNPNFYHVFREKLKVGEGDPLLRTIDTPARTNQARFGKQLSQCRFSSTS